MSDKKHRLSVFLIKSTYENYQDFLMTNGCKTIEIPLTESIQGYLIYSGGFPSPPSWASIFTGIPSFDDARIVNQHSKALLTFKFDERWFCFCFGYSRHLIEQASYERNFGLIVALNISDPTAIKSIDKTNISHNPLQSREQTSREIEIVEFEFNNDVDILKSITAKVQRTGNEEYETLSGRDSVSISSKIELQTFPEIANKLYQAYLKTDYLKKYPWFDKIIQERDVSIIEELDDELLELIKRERTNKVWLAIPEIIDWEKTQGFSYKNYRQSNNPEKSGPVIVKDINLESWLLNINIKDLTIDQLKNKKIFVLSMDNQVIREFSIYRCINAEITHLQKTYILNDSDWYNISESFVSEIDEFFVKLPTSKITLPPYGSMNEPNYLKYVVSNYNQFFLMDRKLIQIGGSYGRVEFCDLYSLNRQIIHVKNYASSSVLSHLFMQALVSSECFLFDENFRAQVNLILGDKFKIINHREKPEPKNYEICIAIMSKVAGELDLPFFSKVSLKNAANQISNHGYKISKLKIPII